MDPRPTGPTAQARLLLLSLAVLALGSCGEGGESAPTPPAGSAAGGPGNELVDFEYSVIPGGVRGKWIVLNLTVRPHDEDVRVSELLVYVFDDDGDGVMQTAERRSEAWTATSNSEWMAVAPLAVAHDVAAPWLHAEVETTAGRVVRAWRLEPPP